MIIGITGALGAGKGTVAAYLTKNKNFVYLSVRNFLAAEVLKQGKMVSREAIAKIAADFKAAHGTEYIMQELVNQTAHEKHSVVIESLRAPAEADFLKARGAKIWAIDTDAKVRYGRLMESKKDAERISFEQFIKNEETELGGALAADSLLGAIQKADAVITNNGTKDELFAHIDVALQQLV